MSVFCLAPFWRFIGAISLAAIFAAGPVSAYAALPDAINAIRLHGCGGRPAGKRPPRLARQLEEAARLIEQHFCAQISGPMLREIGVARRGADTWIVLATPLLTPRPADAPAISTRVLELVNRARAQSRRCGGRAFNATVPLKLSAALADAALAHSLDMATRDYFD